MLITLCLIILSYMIVGVEKHKPGDLKSKTGRKAVKLQPVNNVFVIKSCLFALIICSTLISCGSMKQFQYSAHDEECLPKRVQFNLNHSKEDLAELDKMKLRYFPGYQEGDESLLNALLDSMIVSHLRSFAPSRMDPDVDWEWYRGTHIYFVDYYRGKGEEYTSSDFYLNDLAVERMDTINFDPTCGWQPGMNMNASVDGLLDFYRVHSMYDRMMTCQESDEMRDLVWKEYCAWNKLNSTMYLLLCGYTAANAYYSFAPVDLNLMFEDWSDKRVKELQLELAVLSGEKVRCKRTGNVNRIDFHSLKTFYMQNSDPSFIEAIERYLNEWVEIRNQISLNLTGRQNKQYCRITDNVYMRIFDDLEFMTKIWY